MPALIGGLRGAIAPSPLARERADAAAVPGERTSARCYGHEARPAALTGQLVTKADREKGKRGERQAAARIRAALPEFADQIRRGWQTRLGCDDPDICGLPGFWIEHKCGHQPNMRAAYKQAKLSAKQRAYPIAIIQDDGASDRLVCLNLTDFLRVLRSAYGHVPPLRYGVQQELFPDDEVAE